MRESRVPARCDLRTENGRAHNTVHIALYTSYVVECNIMSPSFVVKKSSRFAWTWDIFVANKIL